MPLQDRKMLVLTAVAGGVLLLVFGIFLLLSIPSEEQQARDQAAQETEEEILPTITAVPSATPTPVPSEFIEQFTQGQYLNEEHERVFEQEAEAMAETLEQDSAVAELLRDAPHEQDLFTLKYDTTNSVFVLTIPRQVAAEANTAFDQYLIDEYGIEDRLWIDRIVTEFE